MFRRYILNCLNNVEKQKINWLLTDFGGKILYKIDRIHYKVGQLKEICICESVFQMVKFYKNMYSLLLNIG